MMHRIDAYRALAKSIEEQNWAEARIDLDQLAISENGDISHDGMCDCESTGRPGEDVTEAIAIERANFRIAQRVDARLPDIAHIDQPLARSKVSA